MYLCIAAVDLRTQIHGSGPAAVNILAHVNIILAQSSRHVGTEEKIPAVGRNIREGVVVLSVIVFKGCDISPL